MKTMLTCVLIFLSVLLASNSCDKNVDEIKVSANLPEPLKIDLRGVETSMIKSDQTFAFKFFSNVFDEEQKDADENFMVSPFSLSMALAMTWNGSDGDTKAAIQNTLGFGNWKDSDLNGYFKKLKDTFEKTDPSTKLTIANSIWTNGNVRILPDFISLNKDYYNATVEAVDFGNTVTVGRINAWAADNTNDLIKSIIEKTSTSDLMYLLNALYFKGIWTSEFDAKNTKKMSFTPEVGTLVKIDMMHQEASFNYTDNENMQVVELPYGNKAFSMMVLLPQKGKKISDVTMALQNEDYWNNLKTKLVKRKVDLFLPKFKTEYSKKLNDILIDMGLEIAFTPGKANFSHMSGKETFISLVKQNTYIATDEVGTEAAAVTAVGIVVTSFPPIDNKVVFKADKPFIYIIQEKSSGSILFMGAVKKF